MQQHHKTVSGKSVTMWASGGDTYLGYIELQTAHGAKYLDGKWNGQGKILVLTMDWQPVDFDERFNLEMNDD